MLCHQIVQIDLNIVTNYFFQKDVYICLHYYYYRKISVLYLMLTSLFIYTIQKEKGYVKIVFDMLLRIARMELTVNFFLFIQI